MATTRPDGIQFRDIFLRPPRKPVRGALPSGPTTSDVRSLTDAQGLIPATAGPDLQRMGERLFRSAVRRPGVFAPLRRAANETARERTRVWMVLRNAQGDAEPWELLCNPAAGPAAFLACERTTTIVRTLTSSGKEHDLAPVEGPVRVLGVIATPRDRAALDVRKEKRVVERALAGPRKMGLLELDWVTGPNTALQLRKALRRPRHVFHFIGHGDFDSAQNLGVLALEDAAGREHVVAANLLGPLLGDSSIRLAVLNSCRGAFAGKGGLLTSTAARLALHIPAVVAMQQAISDAAAVQFCTEFYERLLEGLPVELAVAEARFDLALRPPVAAIEWPAPVVYLSTGDNVLALKTLKARESPGGVKKAAERRAKRRKAAKGIDAEVLIKLGEVVEDDPQKGQWGGSPTGRGRVLAAKVSAIDADWYRVHLEMRPERGGKPVTGTVRFHLHDSFPDPVRNVAAKNGKATLTLVAYGAFTVGAEADGGRTRLELDLAMLRAAPRKFRES